MSYSVCVRLCPCVRAAAASLSPAARGVGAALKTPEEKEELESDFLYLPPIPGTSVFKTICVAAILY